jgi:hypothetical protein
VSAGTPDDVKACEKKCGEDYAPTTPDPPKPGAKPLTPKELEAIRLAEVKRKADLKFCVE